MGLRYFLGTYLQADFGPASLVESSYWNGELPLTKHFAWRTASELHPLRIKEEGHVEHFPNSRAVFAVSRVRCSWDLFWLQLSIDLIN